jgi:prevent-host-death family protein
VVLSPGAQEREEASMTHLPASEARKQFAAILNEVEFKGGRVVLDRHGKPVAAVVPFEDLELLERLEDRYDLEAARAALREPGPDVAWNDLKADLGL